MQDPNLPKVRVWSGGGRLKRKKKTLRTFLLILVVFLALYLVLMSTATFLVQEKFMENFEKSYIGAVAETENRIVNIENDKKWLSKGNTRDAMTQYDYILTDALTRSDSKYFQCSGALFDKNRHLLSKTRSLLPLIKPEGNLFYGNCPVDEYLTPEELKQLSYYMDLERTDFYQKLSASPEDGASGGNISPNNALSTDYQTTVTLTKETHIPVQIVVRKTDKNTENSTIAWDWNNPDIRISEEPQSHFFELMAAPDPFFPYLSYGYESWLAWQENEFLQNLRLDNTLFYTIPSYNAAADDSPPFLPQTKRVSEIYIFLDEQSVGSYFLVSAADCHPWLAAMDSMKYFYLLGLTCMLVCVSVLTFAISRTNRQREALEENRRDFTNAMAHELKTPLCVIRGFAENLKENTASRKREHYLEQIILKTEEMDSLAKEMIAVSRLDSKKLLLKKEPVCLNELIDTQLEKLKDNITRKKLLILYEPEDTFHVTGDRQYLEKVIWNLLSNAIAYNMESGTIRISVNKEQCVIENTGDKIPAVDLPHIFEMFYSGQKDSADEEKHLGLGLYLCKKICSLHHLSLTVRNTEMGVEAILSSTIPGLWPHNMMRGSGSLNHLF